MRTSDTELDVFMPTSRKRLWNALYQVNAVFSCPYNIRLTIACSEEWPELRERIWPPLMERIRWEIGDPDAQMQNVSDLNGYGAAPKIKLCMERLEWANWFYCMADDDCMLPWAFHHFMDSVDDNYGMIIGQVLPVSRQEHLDFTPYTVGRSITRCHVGMANTFFNMRKLETLKKPWFESTSAYSDWHLIERMSKHFRYKIMSHTIAVQSLCERHNLPPEYRDRIDQHNAIGGVLHVSPHEARN